MNSLFLIARIAGERVALPAGEIGSVVEVEEIAPVPRVPPHIAGLFALRSRVLTVVDTKAALGFGAMERTGVATAIITDHEGQSYALLVEDVEDVIEAGAPEPCPALLASGWRPAALGTIRHGAEAILLVSPGALVIGPEAIAA